MKTSRTYAFSRRSALTSAVRIAAAAVLLSACAPGEDTGAAAGPVKYQLSWTKDYEFAGSYLADSKGYWKDSGVEVELLAGGPSTQSLQALAAKQALIASDQVSSVAEMVANEGIDLKVVGALFQKNGLNILSREDNPIRTPKDLEGKKIGVFATNDPAWSLFLELNDVDRSTIQEVPVQFDVTPLVSHEVDGFQGYAGGEVSALQGQGIEPVVMLLADHGYNPVSAGYVVRAESLEDPEQRAQIVAFLHGEIRGWEDVVYNHAIDESARLTVDEYGKNLGLDLAGQTASLKALIPYISTPTTDAHGLLWMSDESVASSQQVIDRAEFDVQVSDIVTTELLSEIYNGKNRI